MPKKKTVPEPASELLSKPILATEAEGDDIPAGVLGTGTDPAEMTGACPDLPLERETAETALSEAEESAAPEILSVDAEPAMDSGDNEEVDIPMPGGPTDHLMPEADEGAPYGEKFLSPDSGPPMDGEPSAADGGDEIPVPGVAAPEEIPDGGSNTVAVEDTLTSAGEGTLDSQTAGPETTAPRRRTVRRSRKATQAAEGSDTPPAGEASEVLKGQPASPEESGRRAFYDLDFNALDRGLSPEQRQEWNSIYASYRGRSVLTGSIAGVDKHSVRIRDRRTGEMARQEMYCAVVILFRVRILIPSTEMWMQGEERPDYVLRNMSGASIDFVVTHVDREAGFAIASRRLALRTRRYYFSTQPSMNRRGARIKCHVLAVGPRRCLVECGGYDIDLTQREMRYTAIPDLREQYRRGNELDCIVKEYDRESGKLSISVKEVNPNPFDGAELRHPEGARRQAEIAGKYAGGVFCNLPDGVVVMCSYSFHYDDAAFAIGDKVIVVIQRYDFGKKQIYGKIVAKW